VKNLAWLALSLLALFSCEKQPLIYDIKDVYLLVGDSGNVKVEKFYITIENSIYDITDNSGYLYVSGTYNLDVNKDGLYDFALCGYNYTPASKGPSFYWSIKPLSEYNKVLCDTVYYSKESFFLTPKNLFINNRISATDRQWLISPPDRNDDDPPGSSYDIFYPVAGFLLFTFQDRYYSPSPPGVAKGNITWTEWIALHEKCIGFLSDNKRTVTIGWMKLKFDCQITGSKLIIEEIGSADFQLKGQFP
jgi:hypothetical protein